MIYTRNRAVGLSVRIPLLLALGCAFAARWDAVRAADLPNAVRSSGSPDEAAIEAHLAKALALLTSEVPADQAKGRDMIVGEVGPVGVGQPSPAFLYAYARALNAKLIPATLTSPNMRVRLNAAIAAARVAEKADNKELAPAIIGFLKDANEAVALWGMKGARFLLKPSLAPGSGVDPIIPIMLATAKKFPFTTAAAYESLRVSDPSPAILPTVIGGSQDLLDARLAAYKSGVPVDPSAELIVASTLSDGTWWKAHKPVEKIRTMQLLVNLGTFAGEHVVAAQGEAQDQLKLVAKQAAGAIVAIGITEKRAEGLRGQLRFFETVRQSTPAPDIAQNAKLIYPAAHEVFPELKPPGSASGGPATSPASMSSTAADHGK